MCSSVPDFTIFYGVFSDQFSVPLCTLTVDPDKIGEFDAANFSRVYDFTGWIRERCSTDIGENPIVFGVNRECEQRVCDFSKDGGCPEAKPRRLFEQSQENIFHFPESDARFRDFYANCGGRIFVMSRNCTQPIPTETRVGNLLFPENCIPIDSVLKLSEETPKQG